MKNTLTKLLTLAFLSISTMTFAQTQKGIDIDGGTTSVMSGTSVSMPDANTVAIGTPGGDVNIDPSGHVSVYMWNGMTWVQKGSDINGEGLSQSLSGHSVCMPDSNTVAIGAPGNTNVNGQSSGHVRIYSWNGTAWTQKGDDIDGEAPNDQSGTSVSMPDANTVAIGALYNDGNGVDAGHVRIYSWNGTTWVQKGNDIDGEAAEDESGFSVSMSDANTIAIGAYRNGPEKGHVRIYSWNGVAWTQKGNDIDGKAAYDLSGCSVSMPDSNTVAIGARNGSVIGSGIGHVRIYIWDGSTWTQKGMDIDGEAADDDSGFSVSMPDTNTVAIGARYNFGVNGQKSGHTRIFSWSGATWLQKGNDIDGEAAYDYSGWSVSMPDSNTVAIGGPGNDEIDNESGHVRIYSLGAPQRIEYISFKADEIHAYPTPTSGKFNLEFKTNLKEVKVCIKNLMGQEVFSESYHNQSLVELYIEGAPGIYFVEVISEGKQRVMKVVKE